MHEVIPIAFSTPNYTITIREKVPSFESVNSREAGHITGPNSSWKLYGYNPAGLDVLTNSDQIRQWATMSATCIRKRVLGHQLSILLCIHMLVIKPLDIQENSREQIFRHCLT